MGRGNHETMNLSSEIIRRRSAGRTTCLMTAIDSKAENAIAIVDRVVEAQGWRGINDGWLEISAADAHAIVSTLLHRDLAYGIEIMPFTVAAEFATRFLDLVPEPHSYFTNSDWAVTGDSAPATLNGWTPISDATFDSGVVCLGDGAAAMLWVEDED